MERYCIAGMIGFPLGEKVVEDLTQSLINMMNENHDSGTMIVALDQDVINRHLAEHLPGNCTDNANRNCTSSHVDLIPCEWSCDWNSCGGGKRPIHPHPQCQNCHNVSRCRSFHFLAKGFQKETNGWQEHDSWHFYDSLDSRQVLEQFEVRLEERSTFIAKIATSWDH